MIPKLIYLLLFTALPPSTAAPTPRPKPTSVSELLRQLAGEISGDRPVRSADEMFRDLTSTPSGKDLINAEWETYLLSVETKLKAHINNVIQAAVAMEDLTREMAHKYGRARSNLPRSIRLLGESERDDLKKKQILRLEELKAAVLQLDRASTEAFKANQDFRWLLLARVHRRVVRSIPDVDQLVPLKEAEADGLAALRKEMDTAMGNRREEWSKLRGRWAGEIVKGGGNFGACWAATSEYVASIEELLTAAQVGWKDAVPKHRFFMRWSTWLDNQSRYDPPVRPAWVRPSRVDDSYVRTVAASAVALMTPGLLEHSVMEAAVLREGPPVGFFVRDLAVLVPWPFLLAEHLGLGRLHAMYDSIGFDVGDTTPSASPLLRPRLRLRVEFWPAASNLEPIIAIDHRLFGSAKPIAKEPFPSAEEWTREVTAGFQSNKTVDRVVGGYWVENLEQSWFDAVFPSVPVGGAFWHPQYAIATRSLADPARGGLAAINNLLQDAALKTLEGLAADITTRLSRRGVPAFERAERAMAAVRKQRETIGLDLSLVVSPVGQLRYDGRIRVEAWTSYFRTMFPHPLPSWAAMVHPWPTEVAPAPGRDLADVRLLGRNLTSDVNESFAHAVARGWKNGPNPALVREVAEAFESMESSSADAFGPTVSQLVDHVRQALAANRETIRRAKRDYADRRNLAAEICWLINVKAAMSNPDATLLAALGQIQHGKPVPKNIPPATKVEYNPEQVGKDIDARRDQLIAIATAEGNRFEDRLHATRSRLETLVGSLDEWLIVYPAPSAANAAVKAAQGELKKAIAETSELSRKASAFSPDRFTDPSKLTVAAGVFAESSDSVAAGSSPELIARLAVLTKDAAMLPDAMSARVEQTYRLWLRATIQPNSVPRPERPMVVNFVRRAQQLDGFLTTQGFVNPGLSEVRPRAGGIDPLRGYALSKDEILPNGPDR